MSTEIGHIITEQKEPFASSTISINRYWGGSEKGTCIQLTIDSGYISFTKDEAIKLGNMIVESFDYDKHP